MKNTNFKQNSFETIKCDSPSHSSVCCNDQSSSLRSLPGLKQDSGTSGASGCCNPAWWSIHKTQDSSTSGASRRVNRDSKSDDTWLKIGYLGQIRWKFNIFMFKNIKKKCYNLFEYWIYLLIFAPDIWNKTVWPEE